MNDRGYTLLEMLVAMIVVGFVVGGILGGIRVVGRLQATTAKQAYATQTLDRVANDLRGLLKEQGPFGSAGGTALVGDQAGFRFDCELSRPCAASISTMNNSSAIRFAGLTNQTVLLPKTAQPHFTYLGSRTVSDHWPPDNPTNWQRLGAIALVTGPDDQPIAVARIWTEGQSNSARPLAHPAMGAEP